MAPDVMTPELALVDPAAAAANSHRLPRIVIDSAIDYAIANRAPSTAVASTVPRRVVLTMSLPTWFAVTTYVLVKVALSVVVAMVLAGTAALAASIVAGH